MGFKTYVCTPAQAKIIQTLKVVGFKFGLSLGGFFICFCLVEVGGGFLCFWGFFYPNHGDFYNSWDGFCPLSWAAIMVLPTLPGEECGETSHVTSTHQQADSRYNNSKSMSPVLESCGGFSAESSSIWQTVR